MTLAAQHFLASLTPEQRAQATFPFQDDERQNWHFIPKERKGLPLLDMHAAQKALAHALLAAGLSQQGYIKAVTIMSLEDVLRILENADPNDRNPEKYYFSVFGEPSDTGTWGYRVEGHHLSQNFTVVNGKVADTPSFFGANPAEVREGPRKGLRMLAAEEDLARDLLESLTPDQKKIAIVTDKAYNDILTMASRKAALEGQPSGLSAAKMTTKQFDLLETLLSDYAQRARAARPSPHGADQESRDRPLLRLGRRPRNAAPALLSHPVAHIPDRVRQYAEQRQPHPLRLARLQRRLRTGSAGDALPAGPLTTGRAVTAGFRARSAAFRARPAHPIDRLI